MHVDERSPATVPAPPVLPVASRVDEPLPGPVGAAAVLWRWCALAVVGACVAVVAWQCRPHLLLADTTAAGGDMGAHVWFPAFLRDELLPRLRVAGWSPDWFAGFPAGQFYFPLPALATVVADLFLPYNVAFKLVAASGAVLLPAAAWVALRGLGVARPAPELGAVAAVLFLFYKGVPAADAASEAGRIAQNQRIMGGPLVSVLAGEYSFTIALCAALGFCGALGMVLRRGRYRTLAAVALAATVCSHLVVGIFAALAGVWLVLWWWARPRVATAAAVGAVAAALTAFWTLPLLATFGYTANMRYEKLTAYRDYLLPTGWGWVAVPAAAGVLVAVARRDRSVLALASVALTFAAVFRFWPELHAWNLRFLPFWYLGVLLVAAAGVAWAVRLVATLVANAWASPPSVATPLDAPPDGILPVEPAAWAPPDGFDTGHRPEVDAAGARRLRAVLAATLVAGLATVGLVRSVQTRGFLDFWAEWNFAGYEHTDPSATKPKAWGEYRALMATMRRLPPGRALWEGGGDLDAYGTPLALMLLPYWTGGRIASAEGLYYESSASTPFVFMTVALVSAPGNASNPVRGLDYGTITGFADGVAQMRRLGVRYYLAHSADAKARAAAEGGLRLVARVPDRDGAAPDGWDVFEVRGHGLVRPAPAEPVVVAPRAGRQSACFGRAHRAGEPDPTLGAWECVAVGWWSRPELLDRPVAAAGPADWRRARSVRAAVALPVRRLPPVRVRAVRAGVDRVRFTVSRTGVPVLVAVSYHPAWRAEGAAGPWRVAPNLMVVVPERRRVTLTYTRMPVEVAGAAVSLAGLGGLAALGVADRRAARSRAAGRREDEPAGSDGPAGGDGPADREPPAPGSGTSGGTATMTLPPVRR